MNFNPRFYTTSGSLTEGVPATSYGPGHYAFRTSILYLGMEPVPTSNESFRTAMNARLGAVTGGDYAASLSTSVSAPFDQRVGPTEGQALTATLLWLTGFVIPEEMLVALTLDIAGALQSVRAQWLTIGGALHAPNAFTLDALNQAIAGAVGDTVRLRHWERRDIVVAAPADSVIARTRMPNACAGARLLSNVTAAACTRVEYTGAWVTPAVQPRATQPIAPSAPASTSRRPQAAEAPVVYAGTSLPPADEDTSPLWYVAGALLVGATAYLIATDKD